MKQIYHHYTEWEDFQNGMYNEDKQGREERVQKAVTLLSSPKELYKQMTRVTEEWIKATEQNLTDNSINHEAFLGQTACSIWQGIHEDETREAWGRLTSEQRYRANRVADLVDEEWHRKRTVNEANFQFSLFDKEWA